MYVRGGGIIHMGIARDFWERMQRSIEQEIGESSPLNRDTAMVAYMLMVLGWVEHRRFSQELAVHGLTVPQFFTLVTIHRCGVEHEGSCTMGVLANETQQCSATMTGIIDRLLKMGLVERCRAEKDRRSVLVKLTEAGVQVLRQTRAKRLEQLRNMLSHFAEEDRHRLIETLKAYTASSQAGLPAEEIPVVCPVS